MPKNEQIADKRDGGGKIKKQSSGRQLVVTVFLLALATKMFLLPIFLIRAAGRDGYIVLAIGAGIDLLSLGAMLAAMFMSKDTDFFTMLESVIGKIATKIVIVLFTLFLFFKMNIAANETLTFYSDNVFAEFDSAIMVIVLLIFLAAVANHTLRALCRLNELLVPLVVVGIGILIAITAVTGFDFGNIMPTMRKPSEFGDAVTRHGSWLGDFTPLALFIGRTDLKKRTAVAASVSGVIGTSVVLFFSMVMCAAFGNLPTYVDSTTNISNILQFSVGNVYGRIDLFSSILWSVAAFVETALFFYATCRCVAYVIGRNSHFGIALGVCAATYFTQVFAMSDPTIFSLLMSNRWTSAISLAFTVAVPSAAVLCGAISARRGQKTAVKDNG